MTFGGIAIGLAHPGQAPIAQERVRAAVDAGDEKRWQAVAPGRIESVSGDIKIGASLVAIIADVLVKAGDKVLAGEIRSAP